MCQADFCMRVSSVLSSIWNTFHPAVFLYNLLSPCLQISVKNVMSVDKLLLSTPYKMVSSNHPKSFSPLTQIIFLLGIDCHMTYFIGIGLSFCCLFLLECNSCSLLNCKSLEHCLAHHRLWVIFVEWINADWKHYLSNSQDKNYLWHSSASGMFFGRN